MMDRLIQNRPQRCSCRTASQHTCAAARLESRSFRASSRNELCTPLVRSLPGWAAVLAGLSATDGGGGDAGALLAFCGSGCAFGVVLGREMTSYSACQPDIQILVLDSRQNANRSLVGRLHVMMLDTEEKQHSGWPPILEGKYFLTASPAHLQVLAILHKTELGGLLCNSDAQRQILKCTCMLSEGDA